MMKDSYTRKGRVGRQQMSETEKKRRKEKLKELLVDPPEWELRKFKNNLRPHIRKLEELTTQNIPEESKIWGLWIEVFRLLDIEHELSENSD